MKQLRLTEIEHELIEVGAITKGVILMARTNCATM